MTCPNMIKYDIDADQMGCKVHSTLVVDIVDFKQGEQEECPAGQKVCCNPGPGGGFEKRLGLVSEGNPLGEMMVDTRVICEDSKLSAAQDFGHGVTCGKRDSRYGIFYKICLIY